MRRRNAEAPALPDAPIVGGHFRPREELRPARRITELDEFLSFLDELEEVFGPMPKPPRINRATRFLL